MLVAPSVDLPDSLLESMEAGKLVVFAGAGVSMGAPANLPNFRGLVAEIGKEKGRELKKGEQPDFFLGELERNKIEIHGAAMSRLGDPAVRHTPLHEALLELFPDGDHVRVVTTNMDDLFASAFRSLHKKEPKLFTAPALPLGSDFTGIVHIHGSVHDEPRRTVFTDEDFGRAYLTEGWARRFLLDLFRSYTVLFVGYSHDDTVLTYLVRGLPSRTSFQEKSGPLPERFSLVLDVDLEENGQKWRSLDIAAIPYPTGSGTDHHAELLPVIINTGKYIHADYVDHRNRITEIARKCPSRADSMDCEYSYLQRQLRRKEMVRFFTTAAVGEYAGKWLPWILRNVDAFRVLFDGNARNTSGAGEIFAEWYAEQVVFSPGKALAVFQEMKGEVSPCLWNGVARAMWRDRRDANSGLSPVLFRRLCNILVATISSGCCLELLCYLTSSCRFPGDAEAFLLLFDHCCKVRLVFEPRSFVMDPEFSGEDDFFAGSNVVNPKPAAPSQLEFILKELRKKFLPEDSEEALRLHWERLVRILQSHLEDMQRQLASFDDNVSLEISCSRESIEECEENNFYRHEYLSLLTDALRDVALGIVRHIPERTKVLVENLFRSDAIILRKMALFVLTKWEGRTPDEKVRWFLDRFKVFERESRHEIYHFLASAYPQLAPALRRELVERIENEEGAGIDARLSLLYWLREADSPCPVINEACERLSKKAPSFRPRPHPDFLKWVRTTGDDEHLTSDALDSLFALPPEKIVEEFVRLPDLPDERGWIWNPYLSKVADIAASNLEWALALLDCTGDFPRLASAVFYGLERAAISSDQWMRLFELMTGCAENTETANATSILLEKASKTPDLSHDLLSKIVPLAETTLRTLCRVDTEATASTVSGDWSAEASGSGGGSLTEAVVAVIRRQSESWKKKPLDEPPDDFRTFFEEVLFGKSEAAKMGRIILFQNLDLWNDLFPEWMKRNLFPRLRLRKGVKKSLSVTQAWHGVLSPTVRNTEVMQKMQALFVSLFPDMDSVLGERKRRFCKFVAWGSLYVPFKKTLADWTAPFILNAGQEDRQDFARCFFSELHKLVPCDEKRSAFLTRVWNGWLKDYVRRRFGGTLKPLETVERAIMLGWLPCLEPVFGEAVSLVCWNTEITPDESAQGDITHIWMLLDNETLQLPERFPESTLRLTLCGLKCLDGCWDSHQIDAILLRIPKEGVKDEKLLRSVENELARLGLSYPETPKEKE